MLQSIYYTAEHSSLLKATDNEGDFKENNVIMDAYNMDINHT